MKIALTGATGFLGQQTISALKARGWQVRALIRRNPSDFPHLDDIEWVRGDLADNAALETLVDGADAVIHAAAAIRGRKFEDFDIPNRIGTRALIAAAEAKAVAGARFIHISSLAARAPHLSHYAASKHKGERIVEETARSLSWTILRPPAVYGPGDRSTLPFFRAVKWGLAPRIGREERPFALIYVGDAVSAIIHLLETGAATGRTVEIDDGRMEGYGLSDLYGLIGEALNRQPKPIIAPPALVRFCAHINAGFSRLSGVSPLFTPEKVRELTEPDWVCSGTRLDALSTWRPEVPGKIGIGETARWYRDKSWL